MRASSTVKPHIQRAGTIAASAPASSQVARSPIRCMDAEKYVHWPTRFYDSLVRPRFSQSRGPSADCPFESIAPNVPGDRRHSPSPSAVQTPALTARSARELLDVFVGGDSTVPPRGRQSAFVLRDLALALVELARRSRGKATVRFYDEPWEMCVERFGHTACLSVYRTGPDPLMSVHDRAVPMDEVVAAVRDAIERHVADEGTRGPSRLELSSAVELLQGVSSMGGSVFDDTRIPELVPVLIEPESDTPLSFGAEFSMREGIGGHGLGDTSGSSEEPGIEHTDLHALLFRGRVRAEIRGRVVDLGECHPLLVAEQLVELARRGFDAWERGLPLNARGENRRYLRRCAGYRRTASSH